jgi:tRNA pseudouridine38-40 synthase
MTRFRLGVSYIGTPFGGFTKVIDSRLPSVQHRLESALTSFLKTGSGGDSREGAFSSFQVSSRTDAGVHALRNVFHVDLARSTGGESTVGSTGTAASQASGYTPEAIVDGLNYYLGKQRTGKNGGEDDLFETSGVDPDDDSAFETVRQSYRNRAPLRSIVITDATKVADTFDARMHATGRTYEYHIIAPTAAFFNKRALLRSGGGDGNEQIAYSMDSIATHKWMFYQHRAWCLPFPVDVAAIKAGAQYLVGEHDFSTFRNSGCQSSSPVRRVRSVDVTASTMGELWPHVSLPSPPGSDHHNVDSLGFVEPEAQLITITVTADSFLLRMVRNMVSALVHVGRGGGLGSVNGKGKAMVKDNKKLTDIHHMSVVHHPHEVQTMLEWRNRSMLKVKPAPAEGLYLKNVHYE